MKILMFSGDVNILNGSSAAARRMAEYAGRVDKLDIIVLARKIHVNNHVNNHMNFSVYFRTGIFWRFLSGFFLAWRLASKNKYDLLVAQDIEHALICWMLDMKFQMQIHSDIFSSYFVRHQMSNRMRAMLAKFLIPRASCIRAVSERVKRSILRTLHVRNIPDMQCPEVTVLPILTELADLSVEPKRFPEFDKTILMVSRLTSEKNIGLAVEAMAEVVKRHSKTGLVIVGDGPKREALKLQITNYKLQKNVRLEGWIESPASYYKAADIFLLTSWYEGWGMSAIEAMRYGAAVIMTDVGLAGELIKDGESGLIVPVGNKNALVAAILHLLENDQFKQDLIEKAEQKVRELISPEEYYERMIDIWRKCCKNT